ncbi:hypothetical protein Clacol_009671 [Clathrus columnatus]|uniref:Uncharacterized protein n=1 Tax=Clathrus columnatus TaxID=1419009 RepID=A0AAV5ARJ3_9AGAM|nr:hypothetical protein Clacol_009671 [Clathrus columnatus]
MVKRVKKGKLVKRFGIVMEKNDDNRPIMLYMATFNKATALPPTIADKRAWFPISPAESEMDIYDPLVIDIGNTDEDEDQWPHGWVSLMEKHVIEENPIRSNVHPSSLISHLSNPRPRVGKKMCHFRLGEPGWLRSRKCRYAPRALCLFKL